MPLLDVCHISFEPSFTIKDESSIFGKEWRMTLEYVLHQPGLNAVYTSQLCTGCHLWVFLCWADEVSREHFYNQSVGFGLLSEHMVKEPSVFLFGEGSYDALDHTRDWTIDVLDPTTRAHGNTETISGAEMQQAIDLLSQHRFVTCQQGKPQENLYRGRIFDNALIALIESESRMGERHFNLDSGWRHYSFAFQKYETALYPANAQTKVPVNIADLVKRQPYEYGVLPFDSSGYSETAYPMSLAFRSMSTLEVGDRVNPPESKVPELGEVFAMCIITLQDQYVDASDDEEKIDSLRSKIGLQAGTPGMQKVSALRRQDEPQLLHFLCAWRSFVDLEQWQHKYLDKDKCVLELAWPSKNSNLPQLQWNSMPLTCDNQSWQKLDKILEIVQFTFEEELSSREMKAFEGRIHALTSTMSSCWSGDIDARPIVYAEDPVWTHAEGTPSSGLLLIAWDGVEQRAVWLQNFVANGFTLTGHLAYALGSICERVESKCYSMQNLHADSDQHGVTADGENRSNESDDSDHDMGF